MKNVYAVHSSTIKQTIKLWISPQLQRHSLWHSSQNSVAFLLMLSKQSSLQSIYLYKSLSSKDFLWNNLQPFFTPFHPQSHPVRKCFLRLKLWGTSYFCLPDISHYNLSQFFKQFLSDCQHCTISFMIVEEIWHLAELCIGYLGVTVQWMVIINIIVIFCSCCRNVKSHHSASQFLSCGKCWPGRLLTHASSLQFHRRSRLVYYPGFKILLSWLSLLHYGSTSPFHPPNTSVKQEK